MITFREHKDPGYAGRTKDNASAHATIAIAVDFESAGETLTKRLVAAGKRVYLPVDISEGLVLDEELVKFLASGLNSSLKGNLFDNEISLNIAGNGIYTMKSQYSQEELDAYVYELLQKVFTHPSLRARVIRIRTGGQTGLDEAGAKAGEKLGIETLVVCPKGWKFRNVDGVDVCNEQDFKKRFVQHFHS